MNSLIPLRSHPAIGVFAALLAVVPWAAPVMRADGPPPDPKLVEDVNTVLLTSSWSMQRQRALIEVDHPELMRALARNEPDLEVRRIATLLLTDQDDLKQQAVVPLAIIREAAVAGITDESFLLHRLLFREEPSPAVRSAIVWTLRTQAAIAEAAQTAYDRDVRGAAAKRVTDPGLSAKVQAAQEAMECEEMVIAGGEAMGGLVHQALKGTFDVFRAAAARRLRSQDDLAAVALAARDHAVLKAVFGRLTDGDLLKKVAAGAADPGMRLAAALKTGSQNLDDLVNEAKALDKEASRLARTEVDADKATAIASNIVAAISLSGEVQNSVIETMQWACKRTIWQRDDSRIQEIVELLALYDDKELARNCSDCRQPDWEDAGYGWYKAHVIQATPRKGGLPATVAADQENGRH